MPNKLDERLKKVMNDYVNLYILTADLHELSLEKRNELDIKFLFAIKQVIREEMPHS